MADENREPPEDLELAAAVVGFRPATPWSAAAATLAVVAILATGIGIAMVVAGRGGGTHAGLIGLAVLQAVIGLAVVWVSQWYGGRARDVLSLARVPPLGAWLACLAAMLLVLVPFNIGVWLLSPDTMAQDLKPFAKLVHSDGVWLALAVVGIGAPLSEELMFRGFLLPALAQSRLGFPGAAVLTTLAWTMLHLTYSVAGLLEVFIVGLLFCWMMWRYGSLWLPMGLHALYNASQMIVLMLLPP